MGGNTVTLTEHTLPSRKEAGQGRRTTEAEESVWQLGRQQHPWNSPPTRSQRLFCFRVIITTLSKKNCSYLLFKCPYCTDSWIVCVGRLSKENLRTGVGHSPTEQWAEWAVSEMDCHSPPFPWAMPRLVWASEPVSTQFLAAVTTGQLSPSQNNTFNPYSIEWDT